MTVKIFAFLIFAAGPALAHELPGAHAHPHGDWSGTLAMLLAAALLGLLFLLPRRSARHSKDDKRDPR